MTHHEPNITLMLARLGPSGVVLPAEMQAALEHSIPIKRSEARLKSLTLWGRITTQNGRDYLLAVGSNGAHVKGRAVSIHSKYFFSQDGIKWHDLPAIDAETATRAAKVKGLLQGDPQASAEVEEADTRAPRTPPEGDAEPAEPLRISVSEQQRLRAKIDAIAAATDVVPCGSLLADANNLLISNQLFTGVEHPDKLEGYCHRAGVLDPVTGSLAADVRGSWAVHSDPFKGVTVLRSLVYLGYHFYYSARELTWGGLYMGDGACNTDLLFML